MLRLLSVRPARSRREQLCTDITLAIGSAIGLDVVIKRSRFGKQGGHVVIMSTQIGKLAIVTGASTGIGYELARCCAENGFNLLIAADEPEIEDAAAAFRSLGVEVEAVEADLATTEGVDRLYGAVKGRPVDALLANAGRGLGGSFVDQDFSAVRHVIDTNITGTIYLAQKVGQDMRQRGQGRILFTGSIAGFTPGSFNATYNGTKAFIDSFSFALRNELKDAGVTVTCLMPGATETEFFERADLMDTKIGQSKKDDPADVAKAGFEAMMNGEGDVVTGWKNKLMSTAALVTPSDFLAEQHRKKTEPGSANK
jgi:short-subunit dehydrogenase